MRWLEKVWCATDECKQVLCRRLDFDRSRSHKDTQQHRVESTGCAGDKTYTHRRPPTICKCPTNKLIVTATATSICLRDVKQQLLTI